MEGGIKKEHATFAPWLTQVSHDESPKMWSWFFMVRIDLEIWFELYLVPSLTFKLIWLIRNQDSNDCWLCYWTTNILIRQGATPSECLYWIKFANKKLLGDEWEESEKNARKKGSLNTYWLMIHVVSLNADICQVQKYISWIVQKSQDFPKGRSD